MKKSILIAVMAIAGLSAKSQTLPIDSATQKVTYNAIVTATGKKDELYSKARSWFATAFKKANYVLQMDDKEAGKLIGKGTATGVLKDSWNISVTAGFTLSYTVFVTVKDGKYRYEITDFSEQDYELAGHALWSKHNYDISDLAINPKYKKGSGEYKKDIQPYLKLTQSVGEDLSKTLIEAMAGNNKDNF